MQHMERNILSENKGYKKSKSGSEGHIIISDSEYPQLLRNIDIPPDKLYYLGDISILKKNCVAIVGTRKPSEYGKHIAYNLARNLARQGFVIVSGLAYGIDAEAHRGALSCRGATIAVLGSGIDFFPASNKILRDNIAESGLIISEYSDGTHGSRYTFPIRNRIISGLSLATVVVEAGLSSGSLITAERASEQGRSVYALPGNIDHTGSLGTNKLIMDGAIPLIALDNVARDMYAENPHVREENMRFITSFWKNNGVSELKNMRNDGNDDYEIGAFHREILDFIENKGEQGIYDLSVQFNMSVKDISIHITILEIQGLVYTAMGKVFIAKF